MKIVTIGMSPYCLTSRGRTHATVLKTLNKPGNPVLGLVWGHDESYHIPEEKDGQKLFYYKDGDQKISIVPFNKEKATVAIHEILRAVQPDLVITVGDLSDFYYMKAVKMYHPGGSLKWLGVLASYSHPFTEDNIELLYDLDGVLCLSQFTKNCLQEYFTKDIVETCSHGVDLETFVFKNKPEETVRCMVNAKRDASDNVPMVIESASEIRGEIPNLGLYVHSNIYETTNDYDLFIVKERFDPNDDFLTYPDKYVSKIDGVSDQELAEEYQKSHIFISVPIVSGSSLTVLEALSCGCFPILSNCGANKEIAEDLANYCGMGISSSDMLVRCIRVMVPGESYIHMADPEDLKKKMINACRKIEKNKGLSRRISEFTKQYSDSAFSNKLVEIANKVNQCDPTICVEVV